MRLVLWLLLVFFIFSEPSLPERDPALTGYEPAEAPESSRIIFEQHYTLLVEAVDYFGNNHQVFDILRDEWEISSGFFASDTDATAISAALDVDGKGIIQTLNRAACLRSIVYYTQTLDSSPALLFNFVTQSSSNDLLIYIYPICTPGDRIINANSTVDLLSNNYGLLQPLSSSGWYYVDRSNSLGTE